MKYELCCIRALLDMKDYDTAIEQLDALLAKHTVNIEVAYNSETHHYSVFNPRSIRLLNNEAPFYDWRSQNLERNTSQTFYGVSSARLVIDSDDFTQKSYELAVKSAQFTVVIR